LLATGPVPPPHPCKAGTNPIKKTAIVFLRLNSIVWLLHFYIRRKAGRTTNLQKSGAPALNLCFMMPNDESGWLIDKDTPPNH
jgi:hypothetical protein